MKARYRKPRKEKKNPIPEWLQTIQLNSWEAELLISALLLYALFQVPEYLTVFFRKNIPDGNVLRLLSSGLVDGIKLLRWGYIIHIVVRGIWVGSVGFSFVFPHGIIKDKLKFRGNFKEELDRDTNLEGFVLQLEQLSSIIYGISFMLFGMLLGGVAYLFILSAIFIYGVVDNMTGGNVWLGMLSLTFAIMYLFLGLLMLADFITNGFFRRDKSVARWFFPLAKIYRMLSFSILYRRSLLVLQTNLSNKWKIALPFILMGFVGSYWYLGDALSDREMDAYYAFEESVLNPLNYESTRDFDQYLIVTIPDQIISNKVLPVFVKDVRIFNLLYSNRDEFKLGIKFDALSAREKVDFLRKHLAIEIDQKKMEPVSMLMGQHQETYRTGYHILVDLVDIPHGMHEMTVRLDTMTMNINQMKALRGERIYMAEVPFFYDKP